MTKSTLPLLFLDDTVVLPGMVVPVALDGDRQAAIDAARLGAGQRAGGEAANERTGEVLIVPRMDGHYGNVGAIAEITRIGRLPTGEPAAVLRATRRAKVGTGVNGPGAALWVEATVLPEPEPDERTRELAREYKSLLISILQERGGWQVIDVVQRITDPGELADAAGYAGWLPEENKLVLLETPDVAERLTKLIEWSREHLAELEVTEKIREDVRDTMEKNQREYLLRQQLAAIRKELGEDEPDAADDYRARVEQADLPEHVREAALREVGRLERASEQSPESGWIRTWLDTILELPWNVRTTDTTDLRGAREVLDADHAGLDDVKDRIVEYLAVRTRRAARGLGTVGGRGSGAVLALIGPPGVGKTSLGESVARALGRKFVRVALGGVRDEAEIRGHRRTYVGAMPGRIARAIKEAGSMNPVVLLDEIDKVGADFRGDPAAALLEVLDPAQNHTFRDHYLEVDLDLSDVLFLATANVVETIPPALLDRMELVTLDGYTEDEKVAIARDHLLPRQLERAALSPDEVVIDDAALRTIAADYTREAGVRSLERALAKILRKVATRLASKAGPEDRRPDQPVDGTVGEPVVDESVDRTATPQASRGPLPEESPPAEEKPVAEGKPVPEERPGRPESRTRTPADGRTAEDSRTAEQEPADTRAKEPIRIGVLDLKDYLGRPRFQPESARDGSTPGVATGLAVTGAGGDVLYVEAATMDGDTGLTLTGQLGDVMKESAQIALSYLRAHGDRLGIPVEALARRRVHIHVPAGAIPKDGPSAGITMTTALASLLSGRPVRPEVGMTGEVSLTGRVLPIGGVKQKLLAAHRAGLTEVILPKRNEPDLDDVPEGALADLQVHLVDDVSEVIRLALAPTAERTNAQAA